MNEMLLPEAMLMVACERFLQAERARAARSPDRALPCVEEEPDAGRRPRPPQVMKQCVVTSEAT